MKTKQMDIFEAVTQIYIEKKNVGKVIINLLFTARYKKNPKTFVNKSKIVTTGHLIFFFFYYQQTS